MCLQTFELPLTLVDRAAVRPLPDAIMTGKQSHSTEVHCNFVYVLEIRKGRTYNHITSMGCFMICFVLGPL